MNKEEIKMHLASCRPCGADDHDPVIAEALAKARQDAELAKWLAQEHKFDGAVAAHVRSIEAPACLRARILAGARVCQPAARWRRRVWLAAAAVVMAFGAVLLREQFFTKPATLLDYRNDVASTWQGMARDGFDLDMEHGDVMKVKAWLVEKGAPGGAELRPGLQTAEPFGCKIIDWRGHKVSMMCFGRNEEEAHLFIVSRDAIREMGGIEQGRMEQVSGYPVIAWTDGTQAYVLVGHTSETDLKEFL